ncbi:MAG: dCMP deaminase family protein [Polyangiaceae bacterium]|nr:dCMP deaminase family protein [Polyangiaceae bacterium]
MNRASWDKLCMRAAIELASKATCNRKHVGAVIARNQVILATGYNESIPGIPHCNDVGHLMHDGHCVRTVHAEANAICQAARNGTRIQGSTLYVTASPCFNCFKLCASAGITTIFYGEFYRDQQVFEFAELASIKLIHFDTKSLCINT